jgi:hypothetical protein
MSMYTQRNEVTKCFVVTQSNTNVRMNQIRRTVMVINGDVS